MTIKLSVFFKKYLEHKNFENLKRVLGKNKIVNHWHKKITLMSVYINA